MSEPKKLFRISSTWTAEYLIANVNPQAHSLLAQLHGVAAALTEVNAPVILRLTEDESNELTAACCDCGTEVIQ